MVKKKLNIPTCDVVEDSDYEENVSPSFKRPLAHVRYKKLLGDDPDLYVDYVIDTEDLVRILTFKDVLFQCIQYVFVFDVN